MLNELQIKAAVIQKLIDSKMLDDAVVINEMVISNWSRRADIAVANGRLYGYEIKSDYDTLKRLDGQISTYTQHFDKTTVIVTQKHLLAAIKQLPRHVEIWEAKARSTRIDIRIIRRGRTTEISDINALYSHLTKTEINCFLRLSGAQVDSSWSRKQLIINGSHANVRRLREYVLSCLKRRYALTSEAFMAARMPITAPSDIRRLSKVKQFLDEPPRNAVPLQKPPAKPRPACPSAIKKIDLLKFEARYGEVPDGMPDVVLKRVRAVNSIQEAQARRLHLP
jgi:hypothetical protein